MKAKKFVIPCPFCGMDRQVKMVLGEERREFCLKCQRDFWVLWSDPIDTPDTFLGMDELAFT
jgi:uncharacterized Zn finger protein